MKKEKIESVLHDWVHTLPFQQQALLMTGMRGPDGHDKHCHAKAIVRFLRGAVLKPAGDWNGTNNNDFMWGQYKYLHVEIFEQLSQAFFDDHDAYPHHFLMHLIHCAEVVGYKHPDNEVRSYWLEFYMAACDSFHMYPETMEQMDDRLNDFGLQPSTDE